MFSGSFSLLTSCDDTNLSEDFTNFEPGADKFFASELIMVATADVSSKPAETNSTCKFFSLGLNKLPGLLCHENQICPFLHLPLHDFDFSQDYQKIP